MLAPTRVFPPEHARSSTCFPPRSHWQSADDIDAPF
jgi:hypothetical protein